MTNRLLLSVLLLWCAATKVGYAKSANWISYDYNDHEKGLDVYSDSTFAYFDFANSPSIKQTGVWRSSGDTLILVWSDSLAGVAGRDAKEHQAPPEKRFLKQPKRLVQLDRSGMVYKQGEVRDSVKVAIEIEKNSRRTNRLLVLSPEVAYQGTPILGLHLLYGTHQANTGGVGSGFFGAQMGYEFSLTQPYTSIYSLGWNADLLPFNFRVKVLGISNGTAFDCRFLPEIGLSLIFLDLTYGYAVHAFGDRIPNISNSKLALVINIPKLLYRSKAHKI